MARTDRPGAADTDAHVPPVDPAVHDPATVSLDQTFDRDTLVALRSAVAAHGGALGLSEQRVSELVVVAHELASNAVRHGGGHGRLLLWRTGDAVLCRVADGGPGLSRPEPATWEQQPPAHAEGGRGLFFVRKLADSVVVSVHNGSPGTTITAVFQTS
jgi:anti-sigma regulatory factor (Ser/Thr protein kinase)